MTQRLLALCSVALTLLLMFAFAGPADARRGGHSFSGARSFSHAGPRIHQPRVYSAPRVYTAPRTLPKAYLTQPHKGHRRFRRHRHIFVGVPVFVGGSYYYYGDCDWLRRRALHTGSPYWWDRYYACVYAYGY
jgi:hypothetical protein